MFCNGKLFNVQWDSIHCFFRTTNMNRYVGVNICHFISFISEGKTHFVYVVMLSQSVKTSLCSDRRHRFEPQPQRYTFIGTVYLKLNALANFPSKLVPRAHGDGQNKKLKSQSTKKVNNRIYLYAHGCKPKLNLKLLTIMR